MMFGRSCAGSAGNSTDSTPASYAPRAPPPASTSPTASREGTGDRRQERTGGGEVGAQLVLRQPHLVRAVVAGVRQRGPGEVGFAGLGPVAEVGGKADPAVAQARLEHPGGPAAPEEVERLLEA